MTYYNLLSVSPDATLEEIKEAHRIAVQLLHPDQLRQKPANVRQYAEERLKQVNEAYLVLRDPVKRGQYDASIGIRGQRPYTTKESSSRVKSEASTEDSHSPSRFAGISQILNEYIFVFALLGLIVGISIQYYNSYSRCEPDAQQLLQLWHQLMQCDVDFITEPVRQSSEPPLQISRLLYSVPLSGIRIIYTFFLPVICGSIIAIICKSNTTNLDSKNLASRGFKSFLLTFSYVITGGIFVVLFYPIYMLIRGLIPIAFANEGVLDTVNMVGLLILYALILFINASGIIVSINESE